MATALETASRLVPGLEYGGIAMRRVVIFLLSLRAVMGWLGQANAQHLDTSALTNAPAQPLAPNQPLAPQSLTIGAPSAPATLPSAILTPTDPSAPPPVSTNRTHAAQPPLPGVIDTHQSINRVLRPPMEGEAAAQNLRFATQQTTLVTAAVATNAPPRPPTVNVPILFNTPEADAVLSKLLIFPPDNLWHRIITRWELLPNSRDVIAAIGNTMPLSCNYDMGFVLVPPDQLRVGVKIAYSQESDPGPYPVPAEVPIEGWPLFPKGVTLDECQRDKLHIGGDRHAIVLDPGKMLLYEFFLMRKTDNGWEAGQASIFNLNSNHLRPEGWTSADAAGLPILPGVVRYDELARGTIDHALRVTVPRTRRAYVAPATHFASDATDVSLPRMGERLRLRADFDIQPFSGAARTILVAMKTHGLFVADNGSLFALSIAPDSRLPALGDELRRVQAADFEVVETPR